MAKTNETHLPLNTGSTLFPLTYSERRRYVICITAELTEKPDYDKLQEAVDAAVENYTIFGSRLNLDGKWPVLERCPLYVEQRSPKLDFQEVMDIDPLTHCARVLVQGNAIRIVYFHALTDGNIGIYFTQNVLDNYFMMTHGEPVFQNHVRHHAIKHALGDAYLAFGKKQNEKTVPTRSSSYVIEGKQTNRLHRDDIQVDMASFKKLAKAHGATVTELGIALFMLALRRMKLEGKKKDRPIRISMPLDLRSIYHAESMGNFVMNAVLEAATLYKDGKEEPTLDELCEHLHAQVMKARKPDFFLHKMWSSSQLTKNKLLGTSSAKSKRTFVSGIFPLMESGTTLTLSNLGLVKAQGAGKDYLKNLDICFTPKPKSPYAVAVLSQGAQMNITLVRDITDTRLTHYMCDLLDQHGVAYDVVIGK